MIINSGCDDEQADADCSLRGAISLVTPFSSNEYVIIIPNGLYILDYDPDADGIEDINEEGDLDINMAVATLQGQSMSGTIIDGNETDRILDLVGNNNPFTLNDLTLRNGRLLTGEGGGGGIRISGGNLILNRVMITQNSVEGAHYTGDNDRGGGINETGSASLTITDSIISHNSAVWAGGIDHRDNTPLVMTGSSVSFNTAIRNGGGMILWGGLNTIERTLIMGNTGEVGGGISTGSNGNLSIIDSTIQDNNSTSNGGGLDLWGPTTLTNVSINHNYAASNGGGLDIWGANGYPITLVEMTNVTLIDNWTPEQGGGIYVGFQGAATLDHVTLAGNTATGGGHAIQAHYGSVTAISTIISSSTTGSTCGFDNGGSLTSNDLQLEQRRLLQPGCRRPGQPGYALRSLWELWRSYEHAAHPDRQPGHQFRQSRRPS